MNVRNCIWLIIAPLILKRFLKMFLALYIITYKYNDKSRKQWSWKLTCSRFQFHPCDGVIMKSILAFCMVCESLGLSPPIMDSYWLNIIQKFITCIYGWHTDGTCSYHDLWGVLPHTSHAGNTPCIFPENVDWQGEVQPHSNYPT